MTQVYPKYLLTEDFDLTVGMHLYHGNSREWHVCTIVAIYPWAGIDFCDIKVIKSGSPNAIVGAKISHTTRTIKNNYLKIIPFNSSKIWSQLNE